MAICIGQVGSPAGGWVGGEADGARARRQQSVVSVHLSAGMNMGKMGANERRSHVRGAARPAHIGRKVELGGIQNRG